MFKQISICVNLAFGKIRKNLGEDLLKDLHKLRSKGASKSEAKCLTTMVFSTELEDIQTSYDHVIDELWSDKNTKG